MKKLICCMMDPHEEARNLKKWSVYVCVCVCVRVCMCVRACVCMCNYILVCVLEGGRAMAKSMIWTEKCVSSFNYSTIFFECKLILLEWLKKSSYEAWTENQSYPFFMTPHGLPFLNSGLRIPDPDFTGSEIHRRGRKNCQK